MAEIVVSAVVSVLVEKLISGDLMKLARSEGIDSKLKKWKDSLHMIQDVLADASQKHITQRSVESWLHKLQDLAYDIDDVLDDMAFEALRRKLNQEPQASTSSSKLLKIIPTCCTNYTPHKIMYGRKISSKLDEITNKLDDVSLYTMHDLMNDLAVSVAGEFNFMLDDKIDVDFEKLHHFSFVCHSDVWSRKFKEFHRAKCLRTFFLVPISLEGIDRMYPANNRFAELIPQFKFLRVLSLSDGFIKEVPQSIGSLIHLRYLNFSRTEIKQIPEQVSDLYNLQSLLVRDCRNLSTLPVSFVKLINLRHLDIDSTPMLQKMPLGIGGLTGLQTLSKVCIEGANGFQISELKGLLELQGRLAIKGLDKVIDPTQATDASLQQKKGLDDLDLVWSRNFDDSRNSMVEYEVLERLRPYCKLRKLKILFYGGLKFPSWVGDSSFDQLTELVLEDCRNCTHLTLGQLSSLRKLSVKSMHEVKTMGPLKGIAFPSLESLKVEDMQGLEMWSTAISFPRLHKISIKKCPKLDKLESSMESVREVSLEDCKMLESYNCPNNVERLTIWGCSSMSCLTFSNSHKLPSSPMILDIPDKGCDNLRPFPNFCLKFLEIYDCKNLNSFPHEHLQSLTSLEEMAILNCPNMDSSFPCGLWPPNLKELRIGRLKKPMSEWGLQNYPASLVDLRLSGKDSGVVSFEVEENASNATSKSFLLPSSLTYLWVQDFTEVESHSEVLQHLTRLEMLEVYSCPKIRDMPESSSSLRVDVYR